MDWLFPAGRTSGAGPVARLLAEHLQRRCLEPGPVAEAERIAAGALTAVAGGPGTLWARLDWARAQPVLTVRHVARDVQLPTAPLSTDGVWAVDEHAAQLEEAFAGGRRVSVELPVTRSPELEVGLPSVPSSTDLRGSGLMGNVAATLARQGEAGASMLESAAAAGAGASRGALAAYVRRHGSGPATPAEVAAAFVEFYNSAGADFFVVEADNDRAVVANRSCPFGAAVSGQRTLCRVTAGLLGSLAAQVNGHSEVVLDEAIADGDARCRAIVAFPDSGSRWAQRYVWPPAPMHPAAAERLTRGFRIALSLQLPRDHLSLGVMRHLVADVLAEVGVVDGDRGDVELAVTEAAANVIEHSGRGDAYEVTLTVGPAMAELRVIDIGRGFDHAVLSEVVAGPQSERGRGLALMHALVDQVRLISAPERGTVVHLVKRLSFDDASPARKLMLASLAEEDRQRPSRRSPGARGRR